MVSTNQQELKDNFLNTELKTYLACPISKYFQEIVSEVDKLRADFDVEIIGEVPLSKAYLPIYRIASRDLAGKARKILITAGVHGNEAGGVNGALKFMSEDALLLNHDTGIICYPCLNPRGYVLNSRWRGDELHSRTDLNRNFDDQSNLDEVMLFTTSLKAAALRYDIAIDLHETMPDDGVVMAMQYPDRDFDPYEKTPESFYMWEICPDKEQRVGSEVISSLKNKIKVCYWDNIFGDKNSGGVIFYPEGAENPDYVSAGPLDSYLHAKVTTHAFTTETYGDVSVEERGLIQQNVVRLIVKQVAKKNL